MQWSLSQKINSGIGAALIIVVIVDVISYLKLTRLIDAVDSVTHTYEILDGLDAVLLHLQNAETGQRGYLITGEESYLEPYHAAIELVGQDTVQLRALIDDWSSHHQRLRLVSFTPLIVEKLAELEETITVRRSTGTDAAQRLVRTDRGKQIMDGIRAAIREMQDEETTALQQRYQGMQASVRGTLHTLGVGSFLGLMLLVLASCVIRHDLAKRQRAEAERVRLETALRRSEKMSAMGALVAGVAHQVRNPLFAMSSTLDALEAHFGVATEYQTYINVLRTEVERLVKLIRQLLDYGKPNLEFFPSALEDVLAEAITACQPLAQPSHVIIASQIPPALPPVLVERERLLQVFQNLLENAIQHSPMAGTVQVKVRQAGEAGKGWLDCIVEDAGPGFRPEVLPYIFDPFFSQRPGGTGLGLSIVQRIVEGYGGTIIAENRAEGGAVIVVRLPIAHERSSGSQEHASYGQEHNIGRR